MKNLLTVFMVALAVVGSVSAAFASDISSETLNDPNAMTYKGGDDGYNTSLTNATRWTANDGSVITPQTMDDPMNPNPAAVNCLYVVKSGECRTFKDPQGKISKTGQPLFVGGKEWHVAGKLTEATSYESMPTCFPPISFYDGSKMGVNTGIGLTNTAINVRSGTGNPFTIEAANQYFRFDYCSFEGTAASGVKFGNSGADMSKGMTFYVKGSDFSDFKGKIILNASTAVRATTTLVVEEGELSFPGTLDVNVNAVVKTCSEDVCSVSTVTCQSNATLQVGGVGKWCFETLTLKDVATLSYQDVSQAETPCITVTDSVTWPTDKKIKVDFSVASGLTRVPLLRFGPNVTATMTKEIFKLTESDTLTYEVVNDELGQTLYANVMEVVTMVKTDAEPFALTPTGGVHWSNNEAVSGDKVYVVGKNMTLNMNSTHQGGKSAFVFPGYQLKVEENAQVSFSGGLLSSEVTNRLVAAGADVQYLCYNGKLIDLLGETFTITGTIRFHCYHSGGFSIKVPITGAGTIVPRWRGKDDSDGFFEMPRDNSGFTGKTSIICWGSPGSADYTPFSTKCLTVRAYDQKNFGGPIASGATAPVYDALTVRDNQVLKAVRNNENNGTVTFDEPTRGIYVPWRGRLAADEGTTLAIKQQVTYAGRIQKIGKGTLALGGTAKFTGKLLDTPYADAAFLAGTNELEIAEGALKPLNTAAFAGVAVIFSNATTLVIAPSVDEGVAQYGLKATAAGSSVSVVEGGMVSVEIDYGDMPAALLPSSGKKVAICTVNGKEESEALRDKFSIRQRIGVNAVLSSEATEGIDGAYTVYATLTFTGLTVTENCSMDGSKLTLELNVIDAGGADKLTVELMPGDKTAEVSPLSTGNQEVVFDGLTKDDYTYQITLSGTYKGEGFTREELPVEVSLVEPSSVTPEGQTIVLQSNGTVDLAKVNAGNYTVSSVAGKKCHLKWTDDKTGSGKYAVMSGGTLVVETGTPANGLDSYESYVLGLDPTDSTAKPYMASVQTDKPNEFTFTLPNINPKSESETGVVVKYELVSSTDPKFPDGKKAVVATATENQLSCDLPSDKVTYYKIKINMK